MPDSDEELLAAIAAGPGALPEFYRRHVAKVIGMGARRFASAEDVADFTAEVFLEVMTSARGFDPGRGRAVAWLYGLASNVASRMLRERFRDRDAMLRLAGRALLADDDHLRVEQRIDANAGRGSPDECPDRAARRTLVATPRGSPRRGRLGRDRRWRHGGGVGSVGPA